MLDVTIANAKRLCRLSDNILDATRIESQSLKLDKEQFNLNDVITDTLDDIITNGDVKKERKMKLIYQPRDILVEADKARITQVMSNLLNNAVKFIKEDGSDDGIITITTEKKENGQKSAVVVTVTDTGYWYRS